METRRARRTAVDDMIMARALMKHFNLCFHGCDVLCARYLFSAIDIYIYYNVARVAMIATISVPHTSTEGL